MKTTTEIKIQTADRKDPMLQLYDRLYNRVQKLIKKGYRFEGAGNWMRVYGKNKYLMICDKITGGHNDDPFVYNVMINFTVIKPSVTGH